MKRLLRLAGGPTSHILPALQPCNHEGKHASATREIIQIICGQDSQRENLSFSIGLSTSSPHFPSRFHTLYRLELNDQDGTPREKIPPACLAPSPAPNPIDCHKISYGAQHGGIQNSDSRRSVQVKERL